MVDQLHQNKHLRTSLDSVFQTEQCLKIPCGEKGKFTIIVCYLPHAILLNLISKTELSSSFIVPAGYTSTLVFLNSSLNPILYCWKIDEVRQAMKETIRGILCY